ncbi:hypothetical protein QUB02_13705 [Microcoleus sp. D3_18_C1]
MNKFFISLGLACMLVGLPISSNRQEVRAQSSNSQRIGGVDLNRYCQQRWRGSYADLIERTAWGWRCFVGSNRYEISVENACKEQYPSSKGYTVVFANAVNPSDPYSWGCFRPTPPLPR